MDTQKLEKEAWDLRIKLSKLVAVEATGHSVKYSTWEVHVKLQRLVKLAKQRWIRRQSKLYDYHPNGFAPSPALPFGALWQGTILDGRHYEIDCADCDSENCKNCGLGQFVVLA